MDPAAFSVAASDTPPVAEFLEYLEGNAGADICPDDLVRHTWAPTDICPLGVQRNEAGQRKLGSGLGVPRSSLKEACKTKGLDETSKLLARV